VNEIAEVAAELRKYLSWAESDGTRSLLALPAPKVPTAVGVPLTAPLVAVAAQPKPAAVAPAPNPVAVAAPTAVGGTLDEVRKQLGDCQRCKLCQGRTQIVFGAGSPKAELVFVGEAPGEQEDLQGQPFVGPAGQLLTKMIEAMKFTRDTVYICNVVKCRPPNNRNPEVDEIAACEPFLQAQLASLRPKVIVALGKFAAQTLLRDATPITRLRGQWREYAGVPLMPTFHPAFLLRDPSQKKLAWADLQAVMKRL
jgi:uracil-DNA glycosylase